MDNNKPDSRDVNDNEWCGFMDRLFQTRGADGVRDLMIKLGRRVRGYGIATHPYRTTPYVNTLDAERQPPYPGQREIERRIKSLIRWNAMAMVVRANRHKHGIGGHISTYASAATLLEVGFHHFFQADTPERKGDIIDRKSVV